MKKGHAAKAVRHENPLMPDERLRQIYTAMLHMRLFERHLATRTGAKKTAKLAETVHGEEAARASTALSLGTGDLILDCGTAPAMKLLLGAELSDLKRSRTAKTVRPAAQTATEGSAQTLPFANDPAQQIQRALGAAAVLKVQGTGRVLLVYVRSEEVRGKTWKRALGIAAEQELPVIFVALPELREKSSRHTGDLADHARSWGVPGFPVDGSDAIPLYRVMQESLLRARTGGGPALLECVPFHLKHEDPGVVQDPLDHLAELLIAKGVADQRWIAQTHGAFAKRLTGSRQ